MADNNTSSWHFEPSTDNPRIGILHINLQEAPSTPPPAPLSLDEAVASAIAAMRGGPTDDLSRTFEKIDEDATAYRTILEAATHCERVADEFREALHLNWTVRGFRHRTEIQDDDLFVRAFRRVFLPYKGNELVLYRGERSSELKAGRIGFNWSSDQKVAKMFASGLCTTYGCDGVLLKATAHPTAIFTGPSHHSAEWLGEMEYIVDPKLLAVEEVARFPPRI